MTTTISRATLVGEAYTWVSSAFSWGGDTRASKPWEESTVADVTLAVGEPVYAIDEIAKDAALPFVESFAQTDGDKMVVSMLVHVLRSLSIAETYQDNINFMIGISEGFAVTDAAGNHAGMPFTETFKAENTLSCRDFHQSISEGVAVAELFGRATIYKLAFAEGASTSSAMSRAMTVSKREVFAVFEEYRRRANAVISDVIVAGGALTMNEFLTVLDSGHAPGFADFRDFIPGDYEYRNALFRAVLESSNADRAILSGMSVTVDVPDVFESGSGVVSNASTGVRINFTRMFHMAPEITLTLKGGTVISIPKLLGSSDDAGFTAILVDPATGANVTGSFTWSAHGY